ncbi:MAG: chain length determinant protein tyrosine kinase EpsG [Rhodocyclaceae bacterium]
MKPMPATPRAVATPLGRAAREEKPMDMNIAGGAPLAPRGRSIGAILMEAGRLSPQEVDFIIEEQQQRNLRFGEAGLKLGLLKAEDIRYALARQFDHPYVIPGDTRLSEKLIAAFRPNSSVVEQMRALRSQLMMRWLDPDRGRKMIAITSAQRYEGRSFIAANLAVVFSQLGERTLLVDADLRNPSMHKMFKLENRVGLSSLLARRADVSEAVVRINDLLGLSVLPAGPIPPNPQELIEREQFRAVLDEASDSFDVIVMDTPAAALSADAYVASLRAGAAVVVARKNATPVNAVRSLTNGISQSGAVVVGSVLNGY